ncbi:hypothetical protein [Pseudoxanthomonas sp.]|jgi:hypothetical protein|uniref:hypothetical protein n=1 Tax=Pseudoxanthomonas sp. TaxID=1871049 RepID=UPI002E138748|nr:hypothetical protein [Pseudoxanthomonas sp.]
MRTPLIAAAALALSLSLPLQATPLDGSWVVDLSTVPGTPYTQPMQLTLNADGTVKGSFYNSVIEAGRWKESRGRLCASFRTTDGVGPYHTAVCLTGDTASGQTWAEHRAFLFNWNATRAPAASGAGSTPGR